MKNLYCFLLASIFSLFLYVKTYSQGLNDLTFGTDSTLEVVTWNIEWFPKNGQTTADSVKTILEALDADVIGFQEIDDTVLFKQVINKVPGYKVYIVEGYFRGLVYAYRSSSIFAKSIYKIYDTSPYWNAFPRAPVVMEFLFQGEDYIVINNHYKCCGDGALDIGNSADEETRRYEANTLLKQYIDDNFDSDRVILIGDLNDELDDDYQNNVFRDFILESDNYLFADDRIAKSPPTEWSYPSWPSHLDHILITNELFAAFEHPSSVTKTIKVDEFIKGGWGTYDAQISDHRPVGMKLMINPQTSGLNEERHQTLNIFPNPTDGIISINGSSYPAQVRVFDITGNLLQVKSLTNTQQRQLMVGEKAGVYFIEVQNKNGVSVQKVVKY